MIVNTVNTNGSLYRENCGWCIRKEGSTTVFCPCLVKILSRDIIICDKIRRTDG